ncbi:unnamed protein product [Paramecium sonneborni]|uniref:Uncharacterized protein n=1 Tax=Paramecium sonneborni TaxID=65129 RepID=A0A8S1LVE8_9CILI|nr:unnamed protein product [Paramecium sonneborni]
MYARSNVQYCNLYWSLNRWYSYDNFSRNIYVSTRFLYYIWIVTILEEIQRFENNKSNFVRNSSSCRRIYIKSNNTFDYQLMQQRYHRSNGISCLCLYKGVLIPFVIIGGGCINLLAEYK